MNKVTVRAMQDDMAKAVIDVAQKYGLRIRKNHARFSDLEVTMTFGFVTADAAAILTKEKADWEKYVGLIGLEPGDFGREFTVRGRVFCITGINLGRTKYPVKACEKGTTKAYKFDVPTVRAALLRL